MLGRLATRQLLPAVLAAASAAVPAPAQFRMTEVTGPSPSDVIRETLRNREEHGIDALWFSSDCVAWSWGILVQDFVREVEEQRAGRLREWLDAALAAAQRCDADELPRLRDVQGGLLTARLLLEADPADWQRLLVWVPRLPRELVRRSRSQAERVVDGVRPESENGFSWSAESSPSRSGGAFEVQAVYRASRPEFEALARATLWLRWIERAGIDGEIRGILESLHAEPDPAGESNPVRAARAAYRAVRDLHWQLWGPPVLPSWQPDVASASARLEPWAGQFDHRFFARYGLRSYDRVRDGRDTLDEWVDGNARGVFEVFRLVPEVEQAEGPLPALRGRWVRAIRDLLKQPASTVPGPTRSLLEPDQASRHRKDVALYSYCWLRELEVLYSGVPLSRSGGELALLVEPVPDYYRAMDGLFEAFAAMVREHGAKAGFDERGIGAWEHRSARARGLLDAALAIHEARMSGEAAEADDLDLLLEASINGLIRHDGVARGQQRRPVVRFPGGVWMQRAPLRAGLFPALVDGEETAAVGVFASAGFGPSADGPFTAPSWSPIRLR